MTSVRMTQFMGENRQGLRIVTNGREQIVQHDNRAVGQGEGIRSKLRRSTKQQF